MSFHLLVVCKLMDDLSAVCRRINVLVEHVLLINTDYYVSLLLVVDSASDWLLSMCLICC